jgi:hypothetical protein
MQVRVVSVCRYAGENKKNNNQKNEQQPLFHVKSFHDVKCQEKIPNMKFLSDH